MKVLKEWTVSAPWGEIALMSWGSPNGEPVLLVHGRQDSAATFMPLMELMPEKYHYVAIDMPGNGRSDRFPIGLKLMRFHFVAAVEMVVKHLGWNRFVYIGHSMGCEQGLFYNVIYPNRIIKLVLLDAQPSLQRLLVLDSSEYFKTFYEAYYDNYYKENYAPKVYSKGKAFEAVMRARGLTRAQAEVILSRNLIEVGRDQYRMSWDNRLKNPAPQNYPVEHYYQLFSRNAPTTLLISASEGVKSYARGKEGAVKLIKKLKETLTHFNMVTVEGGHDVHFTNPERCVKYICDFLKEDFGMSKL